MIKQELLDLLQCPETATPLELADAGLVERLNEVISAGRLKNRIGETVETPLCGGLVAEGGKLLSPVIGDLPVMLADEAILLAQVE